ncbi:hypothetical protein [Lysobacter capsici]|uniref:hypothetical protein n=1 Tax=Lysobacter capsici TaxID=435897 RepID=UPI001BFFDC3C|nr:hypothetical protein [Lysobacter capsici]QWF16897.1 hypothetical protein KME82_24720 [Lysobacter capsici]
MNQPDSPLETEAVRAHGRTHRMACKLLLPALIGLLLTSAGCQRATDRDEAALTAPNPDLNFRILYTEPCTGCCEFHEPGNSTTFYGLPRRDIRAEDIVGLRRYDEQHDKGIELRFAPNADAKIRNLSLEHISHQMAVMIGDQPVRISMIRGVFSGAVVFTGYTLPEREALFQRMTSVPAKDAKSATAE